MIRLYDIPDNTFESDEEDNEKQGGGGAEADSKWLISTSLYNILTFCSQAFI